MFTGVRERKMVALGILRVAKALRSRNLGGEELNQCKLAA